MYEALPEGKHKVLSKEIFQKIKSLHYGKVFCDTTANWNSRPSDVSVKDAIYVYTDKYKKEGVDVPAFKIGDGLAYIVDLPFTDAIFEDHISNDDVHIQSGERAFWNNKTRCYIGDNEELIITSTT